MDVFEAIKARRSVRTYLPKEVPKSVISKILEAGRLSPSSMNLQPWHFIVVTDADKRKDLSEGQYAKFLVDSPLVIVGLSDRKRSPKWHMVDTTIALQTMVLAATAEGLGTCWVVSFYEDRVKKLLKVPDDFTIAAMLAVGYPREREEAVTGSVRPKNRRPAKDIFSYEEFGKSGDTSS